MKKTGVVSQRMEGRKYLESSDLCISSETVYVPMYIYNVCHNRSCSLNFHAFVYIVAVFLGWDYDEWGSYIIQKCLGNHIWACFLCICVNLRLF